MTGSVVFQYSTFFDPVGSLGCVYGHFLEGIEWLIDDLFTQPLNKSWMIS